LAFALSAAHEHHTKRASHLSVEHLFYHGVRRMPLSDPAFGITMPAGSAALAEDGQPLDKHWPYADDQPAAQAWVPPAKLGRLYRSNSARAPMDLAALISQLDAGKPIVLGLLITTCFFRCQSDGFLPAEDPDPVRGSHAVVAVGHGRNADGPHLLVRNSWGESWGANGHAWLSSGYLARHLREATHFVEATS
jgi:hypothetical protein